MNNDNPRPGTQYPVQRKVFDISRPGRAPASSTSRPLISGHKPQIQDPNVTINGVGERRPLMDSTHKVSLIPATPGQLLPEIAPKPSLPQQQVPAPLPVLASAPAQTAVKSQTQSVAPQPEPAKQPEPQKVVNLNPEDSIFDNMPAPDINVQNIVAPPRLRKKSHATAIILTIFVIIILAAIMLNVLIDADILRWDIPSTDFL